MKVEVKMQVRLPAYIRDALKEAARDNHRSMNGQIVAILSEHFRATKVGPDPCKSGRKT